MAPLRERIAEIEAQLKKGEPEIFSKDVPKEVEEPLALIPREK